MKTKPNINTAMSEVASKMGEPVIWNRLEVRKRFGIEAGHTYVNAKIDTDIRDMQVRIEVTMHVRQHDFTDAADAVAFAAEITSAAALVLELEGVVRDLRWGYDELENLMDRIRGEKLEHAPGEN